MRLLQTIFKILLASQSTKREEFGSISFHKFGRQERYFYVLKTYCGKEDLYHMLPFQDVNTSLVIIIFLKEFISKNNNNGRSHQKYSEIWRNLLVCMILTEKRCQ